MSNKLKYEKLERRVSDLEKKTKIIDSNYNQMQERNIVNDIMKETYPGSGRDFFTYDEIGRRNNVSPAKVSRVAEKNGISRRNIKSV